MYHFWYVNCVMTCTILSCNIKVQCRLAVKSCRISVHISTYVCTTIENGGHNSLIHDLSAHPVTVIMIYSSHQY